MIDFLAYITWDVNPNIIESPIMVRYYGLLWASSFFVGLWLMKKMMANDKAPDSYTDKIFIYVMLGAVIGARLGHVFFYDWDEYKNNLLDIFKIWEGGLASHGGLIGIVLALWLYSRNISKRNMLWVGDKVVITVAIAACLIRVGNLMNSEIIGVQSDSDSAFFFKYGAEESVESFLNINFGDVAIVNEVTFDSKDEEWGVMSVKINGADGTVLTQEVLNKLESNLIWRFSEKYKHKSDHVQFKASMPNTLINNSGLLQLEMQTIPRIPTQIWEAFAYLIIFGVMMFGYWKKHWYRKQGLLFGLFLVLLFGARFIIEFWKEHQTLSDDAMLNMGQWLSIIPVVIGLLIMLRAVKIPEIDTEIKPEEFTTK